MKCPYRIITTKKPDAAFSERIEQAFAECYGEECPHYRAEHILGHLTSPAYCAKSLAEELNAKKEKSIR